MLVKASELLKKGTKFNITNFQKSRTAGIIEVAKASTRDLYNFMDFLEGGLKIDLTIMIDFGNGNGEKLSENYLHKIREDKLNCYQQLIQEAGSILLNYSSTNKIEMYGFGGISEFEKYQQGNSNFFQLLSDSCQTTDNICSADQAIKKYLEAVDRIDPSGPILLAPFFTQILEKIKNDSENSKKYQVLIIPVAEEIDDFKQVIDLIDEFLHELPIGVIFIGLGENSFEQFDKITEVKEKEDLKKSRRQSYQFLDIKKCEGSIQKAIQMALGNVPYEIVEYFKIKGINP